MKRKENEKPRHGDLRRGMAHTYTHAHTKSAGKYSEIESSPLKKRVLNTQREVWKAFTVGNTTFFFNVYFFFYAMSQK